MPHYSRSQGNDGATRRTPESRRSRQPRGNRRRRTGSPAGADVLGRDRALLRRAPPGCAPPLCAL